MSSIRIIAALALCAASFGGVASAQAQNSASASPSSNANVWNGLDHQPTEASAPPLSAKREKKVDHTLDTLNKQLLDQKLPKVPAGAP